MLNQRNFEIAKLASKDEDARVVLKSILVAPDKTVVTDGHVIMEITGFEHSGDILPFDDVKPQADFAPFIMPADEALSLAKVFVKSDSKDANLILIDPDGKTGRAAFGLKQPHSEKVFRVESPGLAYPKYETMFLEVAEEVVAVKLNLSLLIPLLQQLGKLNPIVRIGIYGPEKLVRFDCMDDETGQSARAAIMPMKA